MAEACLHPSGPPISALALQNRGQRRRVRCHSASEALDAAGTVGPARGRSWELPAPGGLALVLRNPGEPVKSFAGHNFGVRLIGLPDNPNGAFVDIPMVQCFVMWGETPEPANLRAASPRELMRELKEMKHKD
jgi:hypothetical protein